MSLLIAISTYNEIDNLPSLATAVLEEVPEADLLVVDDASPDGTGQWCDQYAATEPRLKCVHRAGKQGLGTATIACLQYAIDHDYEFVITMDADWSHSPRYLPPMLTELRSESSRPDVVIGSRYVAGGGVEGWPWRRRVMSRCVNGYARRLLGLKVRDTSGAFRGYRVSTLRKLDLASLQSRGYSVFEELLFRLQQLGASFREYPIVFVDRDRGQSKINLREAWTALRIIGQLGVQRLFAGTR